MKKFNVAQNFYYKYTKLKEREQEDFAEYSNKLLSCCLLTSKKEKDRQAYFSILSHLQIYKDYFAIMNYELNYFEKDNVLHLTSLENHNLYHFKKNETIVLLILRKLFYLEMKQISLGDNVTVTIERLHEELLRTGLFEKRINKTEMADYFRIFKKYSLIDIIGESDKDQSTIILYPTILYAVPYSDIDDIDKKLKTYRRGVEDEEIDEDTID